MMKKCAKCGSKRVKKAQLADTITVGGVRFSGKVSGWRCSSCREAYFDGPALGQFEREIAHWIATEGQARVGATFRFMRKAIGMKAADLAALLGVTPETISRYETGKAEIPPTVALALGELVRDQSGTEARLRALRTRPSRRTVRLAS
jgi:putative zinc finger/helix-turn-helix YgiT family protein